MHAMPNPPPQDDTAKTFYIIDGHAQIYRAYFAPFRDLTSPAGEPVKATFVFTQMLLTLVERCKPTYLAMVIDQGGDEGVFRKAIYPQYKANRASRPDDFTPQEQRILQIVRDAGVPIFGVDGFEADDVIATMTRRLEGKGFDVVLVSKDKDLRQLLDGKVSMYDPHTDKRFDASTMSAELGYTPAQAVEVQTLMGDKIDNVPGIPGVGETTAAKLINKYGSVEGVLAHVDELTPKMRENFKTHSHLLDTSRKLVTLKSDVEFDFDPGACEFKGFNIPAMRDHLRSLGFTALLKRLGLPEEPPPRPATSVRKPASIEGGLFAYLDAPADGAGPGDVPPVETGAGCRYELVDTIDKLDALADALRKQKRFAFDTETDALGAMSSDMIGLSVSWEPGCGHYVAVRGPSGAAVVPLEAVIGRLGPIFADPAVAKVGHNVKYDLLVLRNAGIDVRGITLDTMVGAFILDASRTSFGIDRLALDLLNFRKVPTEDLIGKGKSQISMEKVDLARVSRYAAEDADIALRLANHIEAQFDALPELRKLNDTLETPLIPVLADMEAEGISVDEKVLREQSAVLGERIEALRARIHTEAGCEFVIDSPKQLGDVLFNKLGLRVIKKTKTGASTDVEVLERLAGDHPVPRLVLDYRSLVTLKNTYLDNLTDYVNPRSGRVHTHFNQTGAATGRLSSSDPNLQNIPIRTDEGRRIRLAFVPGDRANNVLLTADYSQIELRVLAHFTQEPALLRAFERDEDIHRAVAAEVFGVPLEGVSREQRSQAKTINFGIIYGVTAFGLSRRIDGLSVSAAGDLIKAYNQRFPAINRFMQQCVAEAQDKGYVTTILGRRRPIPEINSSVVAMRGMGERQAINSVVQGSAADLIKVAMIRLHQRIAREGLRSRMLLQVHDELVLETPRAVVEHEARIVQEEMIGAGPQIGLTVPIKVESGWGDNWQEVK